MASTGPTRYQEYGLRIPLYDKHGKKLVHARSAKELEALGRNILRRIVEMYDRQNGYKLFDLLKTNTAVAKWIERVETLALGPHPESKLPSTEKEDILVALKFKKAPQSQTKNDAPGKKLNPQQAASLPKAKAPQQAAPPKPKAPQQAALPPKTKAPQQAALPPNIKAPQSQAKQDAPGKKLNPQTASSRPKIKAPQSLSSLSKQDAPGKQPNLVQKKRKLATPAPSDAPQTPAKKKKPATPAPKAESTDEFELELEEAMEQEFAKPSSPPPQVAPATNKRKHDDHATPPDTHEAPGKKRKTDITSSIPAPSTPPLPPAKAITPQPPSPQPRSPTPTPDHTTPSPPSPDEEPFRAPSHHGPHGTFTNHPSLLTGRGHQVPPSEWSQNLAYQSHRYNFFHHTCPYYPFIDRERRIRAHEGNVEGLRELREMEGWMRAYRERWPGECVGHLWDCGCVNLGYYEKVGGGEVSEE